MTTYTSPLKRWPGTIELPDYMTWPQLAEWEDAIGRTQALGEKDSAIKFYTLMLPTACRIVAAWKIAGLAEPVTPETFPASPRLMAWVVESVTDLFRRTSDVDPNS